MENVVNPFMSGAYMFLEAEEWNSASEYFQKVINQEPQNTEAYLGKLMAELHFRNQEELSKLTTPFTESENYKNNSSYNINIINALCIFVYRYC